MKCAFRFFTAGLLLLSFGLPFSTCFAQGTAFTYQGRLNNGTNPANGSYDLAFSLFATNTGGAPIAGPATNSSVAVSNGLFTTTINFSSAPFDGRNEWLEISVRTNGGASFATLVPRQPVTPTPYAITALGLTGVTVRQNTNGAPNIISGATANYVSNGVYGATIGGGGGATALLGGAVVNGSNSVTGNFGTVGGGVGNVASGYGSTVSGGEFNVASGQDSTVAGGNDNTAAGVGSFAAGYNAWALHDGSFVWADDSATIFNSTTNNQFLIRARGGVGIGTASPGSALDVRGDIHLGVNGQLSAPGGEENLRILRGVINPAGGVIVGSGFGVSRGPTGTGLYTISFNTPFPSAPAVTATADSQGGTSRIVMTDGATGSYVVLRTQVSTTGAPTDCPIHFIIIGPR